jgi:hypothetical protein
MAPIYGAPVDCAQFLALLNLMVFVLSVTFHERRILAAWMKFSTTIVCLPILENAAFTFGELTSTA